MECASEPDGIAAGAGALPRARRRCEAGKRTHGPGTRACLALLAATALLALAAPAQAQTEIWSATLTPRTRATAPSAATPPRATPRLSAATPPSSPTTTSRSAPLTTPSGLSSWQVRVYKSLPPASSPTPTPSPSCWAPPLSLFPAALPSKAALAGSGLLPASPGPPAPTSASGSSPSPRPARPPGWPRPPTGRPGSTSPGPPRSTPAAPPSPATRSRSPRRQ